MDETKSVKLKKKIYDLIELKIKDPLLGFESVDDYVLHIIEKALETSENSDKTKSEDELVEEKLKQLGYI
jgi:hypothetical protein